MSTISSTTRPAVSSGGSWLSALALTGLPRRGRGDDGPSFQIMRTLPGIELRRYSGYSVAEVRVPGPPDEVGNRAFPILAGYLFGRNRGARKLPMITSVLLAAAGFPRESGALVPDGFVVQVLLPAGMTQANAPDPEDGRVQLLDLPSHRMAVSSYSGRSSAANDGRHLSRLRAGLRSADLAWIGEAIYARYNSPFTPWFLRRNEVWLRIPG